MNELSKKLKFYIKKSNTNVYQISLNSHLDRTMLQKMVNGTKWPSVSFFAEFLDYLILNKKERDNLLMEFMIEKIGVQRYNSRKAIDDLLAGMKHLSQPHDEFSAEYVRVKEIKDEVKSFYSTADLKKAFDYIAAFEFKNDHPAFYLGELSDMRFAMKTIMYWEKKTRKQASIYQHVGIRRENAQASNATDDIERLGKIFPWAYYFQKRYHVYYAYLSESVHNKHYRIFDRFIVTGERILLLSFDGQEGLLIQNESVAAAYRHEFEKLTKISYRMFEYWQGFESALDNYQKIANHRLLTLSYEAVPSGYYLAGSFFDDYLKEYQRRMSDLKGIHHFKMIVDSAYVIEFAKTGRLPENYAKDIPPLSREQVIQALRSYLHEINLIDDVKFIKTKPENGGGVNIDLYAPNQVVFSFLDSRMPFAIIVLKEIGIYNAFMDYFSSLEEMGKAEGKETGMQNLQSTLERIIKNYDNDHK